MIFLNSTSDQFGSRMIRYGRESDSSHFAVCFGDFDDPCAMVIHSTMGRGVHPVWLKEFKKNNRVTSALKVDISRSENFDLYEKVGKEIGGKDYDQGAITYWVAVSLWQKITGSVKVGKNKLGDDNEFYCVEVLWALREFLRMIELDFPNDKEFFEMMDPQDAYEWLKKSPFMKELYVG